MNAVVFVGPSLDRAGAGRVLDARFLPPVGRGDVDALLASSQPPTHIGIVDGVFLHRPSISPKEILSAIDRGVRFYGASSMGALRAVELAPYGMVGVGQIYELFQSGELDADDEVAITFDPESLRNLCEPLVNMRIAFAAAAAAAVLSTATATALVSAAKALYFPQRTYRAVLEATADEIPVAERRALERFLAERAPNAKHADALALLARIRLDLETVA